MASVPQFPQVMMWIYGGRLRTQGMASMYNSSALAAFTVVMVIIIQYCLDVLGFFR